MRILIAAAAVILSAAGASAAGFARPDAGDSADYSVRLDSRTTAEGQSRRMTGDARARVVCLASDADASRFVVLWNAAAGGGRESLKDSLAFLALDDKGRVLPDLNAAGLKISLDAWSWTGHGMIGRIPADLARHPGRRSVDAELHVYGELQKLPMIETVQRRGDGWVVELRPARDDLKLKIGRQTQPVLKDYLDRWTLDASGRPAKWEHLTAIRYDLPGKAPLDIRLEMSADRQRTGTLPAGELDTWRRDAAWLKPVWTPVVNPEPGELKDLNVSRLEGSLTDFLRDRPDSPLIAGARVLKENLGTLGDFTKMVDVEEREYRRLAGHAAPDFSLRTVDGKAVRLSDYRGKTVLLVFWGLGCRLCRTEAPHLTELHEKYKDKGFTVLAVEAFDNDSADVKAYMREQKLSHPVVVGGAQTGSGKYFIAGLPRAFWIDRNGVVVDRWAGGFTKDAMEAKIQEMLRRR